MYLQRYNGSTKYSSFHLIWYIPASGHDEVATEAPDIRFDGSSGIRHLSHERRIRRLRHVRKKSIECHPARAHLSLFEYFVFPLHAVRERCHGIYNCRRGKNLGVCYLRTCRSLRCKTDYIFTLKLKRKAKRIDGDGLLRDSRIAITLMFFEFRNEKEGKVENDNEKANCRRDGVKGARDEKEKIKSLSFFFSVLYGRS
ncbi:hypothetical protein Trydic_g3916 [Trypoxylus dichotomus]